MSSSFLVLLSAGVIMLLLVALVFMAMQLSALQRRSTGNNNDEESGGPLASRWQEAMERTRAALAQANEETDFARRLAALDAAIDSVRLIHSRATSDLQREAATALEATVRGAWRSAQGELHLTQARAALRRALGNTDELAQRAAWDEFGRERDKARGFGVSEAQLRVLESEVQGVAAALGTVVTPDAVTSETTSSSTRQGENA
jgi:Na+-transporting methylmalonyl-CoA/oxaloacetate decarboxylase gamma subunit